MGHYASRTPKRHQAFSNNRYSEKYNKGVLSRAQRPTVPSDKKSSITYTDKEGTRRWVGTKNLKATQ